MVGRPRTVLALGTGTVVLMAGLAGLGSGEHTLTLAIGALGATLTGVAWLLLSAPGAEGHRSIGHAASNIGPPQASLEEVQNLPDPIDSDMDMPL